MAAALLISAAYAILRVEFEGPALGDKIASVLNKRMRGRIEVGAIEWSPASLSKVVTGGWVPISARNVRVWDDCALSAVITGAEGDALRSGDPNEDCTPDDRPDPDPRSRRKPRKLLLSTDLVTAEIDIHALMFGNHDFVFRRLWVHGGEALLEQTREPYPLHDYDHTIVSMVTAFYPRLGAGFHAGIYADAPPPIFDLRDIHITGLNLTLHMNPSTETVPERASYGFTARLEGVDVDGSPDPANNSYLYMDATDPLISKFYVRLTATARRGLVRILDEGPRVAFRLPTGPGAASAGTRESYPAGDRVAAYQLTLADIRLDRLAQLPSAWSRTDFVANTLEVDLQARAQPCSDDGTTPPDPAAAARLHLSGELFNYWDRPYDGAWNLMLDARNLGPTLRSCIAPTIGGDRLDGAISLTGPFVAQPAVGLDLTGVDFDIPLRKDDQPLRLTIAELHGKIDLVNEEGYIEKTKALVRGGKEPGEVDLSATFGLNPYYGNAQVEIVKAIDVGRFLPRGTAPLGTFLQGRLRAIGDVEKGFELSDFDLTLGATPREKALRLHHGRLVTKAKFDEIEIENVYLDAGRSHASINGWVNIVKNDMNVRIDGEFPDLDVWLRRFGLPALLKSAGAIGRDGAGAAGITLTGPPSNPRITVSETLLSGVPCFDRVQVGHLQKEGDVITANRLSFPGLGGPLTGNAKIVVGGARPRIERLDLKGSRLDASRLCGLRGIAKGAIDEVDVHVQGDIDPDRDALGWLGLGQVFARAQQLTVYGDRYTDVTACLNRKDDSACRRRPTTTAEDLKQCEDGKRASAAGARGFCLVAAADREAGGTLDATVVQLPGGRPGARPRLAGVVAIADLPLALIDQLRGKPAARSTGGLASITMHLQGAPAAPQAVGAIQILRSWLASGFIGDAHIAVEPADVRGVPGLAFHGQALAGRLAITGSLGTAPPYPVELSITARRVEIDPFLDLRALLGQVDPIQAWASGTIALRTELAPDRPMHPASWEAWIELTELSAQLDHRASDGRITPLVVRLKDQDPRQRPAMSIYATPTSLELACRDGKQATGRAACTTILETPAGDIVLSGQATKQAVKIAARGKLDIGKLKDLLDQRFDQVAGTVGLDASIGGSLEAPTVEAAIDLDPDQIWQNNQAEREARRAAKEAGIQRPDQPLLPNENSVVLRPVGTDTLLAAPRGLIKLAYGTIGFTDVMLKIQDRDNLSVIDEGDLHVAGNIELAGLTPTSWSVLLSGKLAGKMLQLLLPSQVAQANGLVEIDGQLLLSGSGPAPAITGTLMLDRLSIIPRGLRRELMFNRGSLDIATESAGERRTYTIDIADVEGAIDEGELAITTGSLRVRDGELIGANLILSANSIPFKIPQTLDLVVSARDVAITLDSRGARWRVTGAIDVIDGAYLRNFELTDRIQTIGLNTAPTRPFWEEYPVLGNAELDLSLAVQLFAVRNNIATIEFRSDSMQLSGSPRDPRLSGEIRVTQGEFRIPGTRARFTRTTGTVDFAANRPASNPELRVTSDADYRDLSGQDHVIIVTIGGTLQLPTWDLKTSSGYNKSQTLSLLVLGRNQEQLRRSLGDQSLGGDPTRADPTTNPSQGFADQIVKDLAGDWVSDLLGSSLTKLSGLDVLRIEIGFGSIGLHVEKKMLENARVLGNFEQTIRGTTIKALAELKTPFAVSLQGGYLNLDYYDPAEQDISDLNVKLVYRYRVFIP